MSTSVPLGGRTDVAGQVAAARAELARGHAGMVRRLDELFRSGHQPSAPLAGRYSGTLVVTTFGPWRDRLAAAITARYMPWRGKVFEPETETGGNLFAQRSKGLIRPFDPAVHDYAPGLVYAYPFRTYTAPGLKDPDRTVLKIDYNIPANRFGPIRRVLDELVELAPGYYLGKAHLRVLGRWHTVAFFSLQSPDGPR